VVAASGGTGGFSAYGGLVTKERILRIEGATLLTGDAAKQLGLFDGAPPEPSEPRQLRNASRN
jgi:hypothetical protein